jgi:hypothetical protein
LANLSLSSVGLPGGRVEPRVGQTFANLVPADRDPADRAGGGGRLAAAVDPDPYPRLGHPGRFLLDRGIYVTFAFYPGVPREEVGFRIQVTAANTDDQVSELLAALDRLADVVPLRQV